MLAQAGRAAGLAKRVHAHALRHAFAVAYLAKGRPLADLQALLGHANSATTRRYIEVLQAATSRTPPEPAPCRRAAPERAVTPPLIAPVRPSFWLPALRMA